MKSKHTSSFTSKHFCLLVLLVILDQIVKHLLKGHDTAIIEGILSITFKKNFGAAFGILPGMAWLLVIASILIIIFLGYYRKEFNRIGLVLILAGTISNLIDRVFLGYVIDYINVFMWPTFNIADSYNVIGAAIVVWHLLKK